MASELEAALTKLRALHATAEATIGDVELKAARDAAVQAITRPHQDRDSWAALALDGLSIFMRAMRHLEEADGGE